MTVVPNRAAQNAVKALIQCGIDRGTIKRTYQLKGHRDGSATGCPGDLFYNKSKLGILFRLLQVYMTFVYISTFNAYILFLI
jgi:hypothetical protein